MNFNVSNYLYLNSMTRACTLTHLKFLCEFQVIWILFEIFSMYKKMKCIKLTWVKNLNDRFHYHITFIICTLHTKHFIWVSQIFHFHQKCHLFVWISHNNTCNLQQNCLYIWCLVIFMTTIFRAFGVVSMCMGTGMGAACLIEYPGPA